MKVNIPAIAKKKQIVCHETIIEEGDEVTIVAIKSIEPNVIWKEETVAVMVTHGEGKTFGWANINEFKI